MYISWQDFITLNLIILFDLYLFATFLASLLIRYQRYREILALIRKVPDRWPKLFELLRQERQLYLNWVAMLPVLAAFAIAVIHTGLYRLVWHSAEITPGQLAAHWLPMLWIGLCALLMVGVDCYMLFNIQPLNVARIEGELDKAEYWLKSWVSSAIQVATLGCVSPRKIVRKEIRKAIANGLQLMDRAVGLWLVQIGGRLLFGCSLWLAWAYVIHVQTSL